MQWPHLTMEVVPLLAVISPLMGLVTTVIVARWSRPLIRPLALSNSIMTVLLLGSMVVFNKIDSNRQRDLPSRQIPAATRWLQVHTDTDGTFKNRGIDVRLSFAVDGLSVWPAFLVTVMVWVALASPGRLRGEKDYFYVSAILLSESLLLGGGLVDDAITQLVFFECSLLPIYLLVGTCGDTDRRTVASSFWMWQLLGGAFTLFGVTLLAVSRPWMQTDLVPKRGPLLFDTPFLLENLQYLLTRTEVAALIWGNVGPWICLFLVLGFAVRLPIFPFHGWYEITLRSAPAGVAALIALSYPLIAMNAWLRLGSPLFAPDGHAFTALLGTFSIVGLWRSALVAYRQTDVRNLMATISSGLLCLACIGLNSHQRDGIRGAWLLVLTQGLAVAVGILATDQLQRRCGTCELNELGRYIRNRPRLSAIFIVALIGWTGMPFLSGFASLCLILTALTGAGLFPVVGVVIALALLAGATLRAIACCLIDSPDTSPNGYKNEITKVRDKSAAPSDTTADCPSDLPLTEIFAFAPLASLLVGINLFPSAVLDSCEPLLNKIFQHGEQMHQPYDAQWPAHPNPPNPKDS